MNTINLSIAAMDGQAKIGEIILDAVTILQNPRAFNQTQNSQALDAASSAFGNQSGNIKAIINLGRLWKELS